MFAQQLPCARIHQSHMCVIPLHLNAAADPARRSAVVRRFDFHATIQMDCTFAVLVVAKRLQRQGQQDRKSTRLNSSHRCISYAVFCLKKKKKKRIEQNTKITTTVLTNILM